jgi:hypothetical protein
MSLEGKTDDQIKDLERQLLNEVEQRNGVAGNISLLRELKWDEDLYWSIRDRLIDAGQLELGKGKGGSVRRVFTDDTHDTRLPAQEVQPVQITEAQITEAELYEPIAKVLKQRWVKDNRFRDSVVEITAKQGKRDTGGKWSRPDITVVGMTNYIYVPGKHFDVATFEVKSADWMDVTAVYEALAHRRAATRAYVIIYVPEEKRGMVDPLLDQVCEEAKRHGVGVIVVETLEDYETWDERVEAVRIECSPGRLNDFIAVQLSEGAKQEILQWPK